MRILAVNSSFRPKGAVTRLAAEALAGAASVGAQTEMLFLAEKDIRFCANCLTCYQDRDAPIGRCAIEDDMRGVLEAVAEADGILLASPVHSGFVNGLMTTFFERAVWPLCRPTGELMGVRGVPEPRLTDKARASASIVSAGMVPPQMRQYCDLGTPWLRDMAPMLFNGEFVGDMYAAGLTPHPLSDEESRRGLLLRRLTDEQLREARELGVRLAETVKRGARPYEPGLPGPPGAEPVEGNA